MTVATCPSFTTLGDIVNEDTFKYRADADYRSIDPCTAGERNSASDSRQPDPDEGSDTRREQRCAGSGQVQRRHEAQGLYRIRGPYIPHAKGAKGRHTTVSRLFRGREC